MFDETSFELAGHARSYDDLDKLAAQNFLQYLKDQEEATGAVTDGLELNERLFLASKELAALRRASVLRVTGSSTPGSPDVALLRQEASYHDLPQRIAEASRLGFGAAIVPLEPGRHVYVEHSNEVWNNFPQGADIEQDAQVTETNDTNIDELDGAADIETGPGPVGGQDGHEVPAR